jgi:hypothetical protein
MSDPSNDDDLIGEGYNDLPSVGAVVHRRPRRRGRRSSPALPRSSRTRAASLATAPSSWGEYSIPAVVGTSSTTAMIRDGQRIEADGTSGSARIVAA